MEKKSEWSRTSDVFSPTFPVIESGTLQGLRIMRYSQPMSNCIQKPTSRVMPAVIPFAAPSVDPAVRFVAADSPVSAEFFSAKPSLFLRT